VHLVERDRRVVQIERGAKPKIPDARIVGKKTRHHRFELPLLFSVPPTGIFVWGQRLPDDQHAFAGAHRVAHRLVHRATVRSPPGDAAHGCRIDHLSRWFGGHDVELMLD
jgi:hypothetical protein